jgi:hypothetical protein
MSIDDIFKVSVVLALKKREALVYSGKPTQTGDLMSKRQQFFNEAAENWDQKFGNPNSKSSSHTSYPRLV